MKYFDLHADTATRLFDERRELWHNDLHISLDRAEVFEKYIQAAAIFTSPRLSDSEGWDKFLTVRETLLEQCEKYGVSIITSRRELDDFVQSDKKTAFILAVEDARILDSRLERVRELYSLGVRVVTPLWGSSSCIGGAHNYPDIGLTDFGKEAVREMLALGMLADVSHASRKATEDIIKLCEEAGVPPIATHSNSASARNHSRNLNDNEFKKIVSLGGIVGLSLCPEHLTSRESAKPDDVLPHAVYYETVSRGHLAMGCDLDGTSLPEGISGIESIPTVLYGTFREFGISREDTDRVFWDTAYEFFLKNLPEE